MYKQNSTTIWTAFKKDISHRSFVSSLLSFLVIGWVFYVIGPFNEIIRVWIISLPYSSNTGIARLLSIPLAFATTFSLQFFGGSLIAYGFDLPKTTRLLKKFLHSRCIKIIKRSYTELSIIKKALASVILGTTIVILWEQIVTGKTGFKELKPNIILSSFIMASWVTCLSAIISIVTVLMEASNIADKHIIRFSNFISNPITWVIIIFAATLASYFKKHLNKKVSDFRI